MTTAADIADKVAARSASLTTFIDGEFVPGEGPLVSVENPYTEQTIATVAASSAAQVDRAVAGARAAEEGSRSWGRLSRADRRKTLTRMADALDARKSDIVDIQIGEAGMYRMMCEFAGAKLPLRAWHGYAELAGREWDHPVPSITWPTATGMHHTGGTVFMEPVGVVSAIVPFNFPFMVATHKVAAALAAGCSVVLKASELTPLACALIAEAAQEAELPPGAFQYVIGEREVGARMVEHPDVDCVSFTGSAKVGGEIAAVAGRAIKKVVLELGGKSAAIVLDDADLDTTMTDLLAQYSHGGQGCVLTTRFVLEEGVADDVVQRMAAMAGFLTPGDPSEMSTTHSPQITTAAQERILGVVRQTMDDGAELVYGGTDIPTQPSGHWVAPTLFDNCPVDAPAAQEEIFGPVLVVHRVKDDAEAVAVANNSPYGLGGAVHTRDIRRGVRVAKAVRTGVVGVNGLAMNFDAPFGGVKQSGVGREFGEYGVREFLEPKAVSWHP